jgi:hypothetical protein
VQGTGYYAVLPKLDRLLDQEKPDGHEVTKRRSGIPTIDVIAR